MFIFVDFCLQGQNLDEDSRVTETLPNNMTKNTTMNNIEKDYIAAYNRAMKAIKAIKAKIHDLPAPEGETKIDWGHVGYMICYADHLEEIAQ